METCSFTFYEDLLSHAAQTQTKTSPMNLDPQLLLTGGCSIIDAKQVQDSFSDVYSYYIPKTQKQQKIKFYLPPATESKRKLPQQSHQDQQEFVMSASRAIHQQTENVEMKQESSLLKVPIEQLIEQVKEESQVAGNPEDQDQYGESIPESMIQSSGDLWIDKYTSQKFFDLLTDEQTNRKVLTWLRSWDEVVFPHKPKVSLKPPTLSGNKGPNVFQKQNQFKKVFESMEEEFSLHNKKVLMLYGPPGTGKSTMARVLAAQCGYQTQEVNASDLRTGAQLVNLIKNTLSMDAHFDKTGYLGQIKEKKPNCLIIDEVDGALGGGPDSNKGLEMVAQYLSKCIKAAEQVKDESDMEVDEIQEELEQDDKPKTKKKKQEFPALNRPIIFICNDGYARALTSLKDIVLRLKIQAASKQRITDRLYHILTQEGHNDVDFSALQQIVEQSDGDARSCINTVQFFARTGQLKVQSGEQLKEKANVNKVKKDRSETLFSVAEYVMYDQPEKNRLDVIREIQDYVYSMEGETQHLNDSLYENYPTVTQIYDDFGFKVAFFLDCLSNSDLQESFIGRTQNYSLKSVQFVPAAVFKLFCANYRKSFVQYPKLMRQYRQDRLLAEEVGRQLLNIRSKKLGVKRVKNVQEKEDADQERYKVQELQSVRPKDMFLDIFPYVYIMIHPQIRDINVDLFSEFEKESFKKAIEIMVTFDIKLDSKSSEDSSGVAKFEPDLKRLVCFGQKSRLFMRNKTQVLILQNYEGLKQRMLSGDLSSEIVKKQELVSATQKAITGIGLFSLLGKTNKKRKEPVSGEAGKFTFKFKEGHSKNFKRELAFDYFVQ